MLIRKKRTGFTLIEMLLVVGLIVIILGMFLPTWREVLKNVALDREVSRFTTAIQTAQTNAIKEMRPWRVRIDSDGGGFRLEYMTTYTQDPVPCDPSGWTLKKAERFTMEFKLSVGTASRLCLPFGQVGRPLWPLPTIGSDLSTPPLKGEVTYLVDGERLRSVVADPMIDNPPWVVFPKSKTTTTTILIVDLGEVRYVNSPCLGLYSDPPNGKIGAAPAYVYPTSIRVQGSLDPTYSDTMTWSVDKSVAVPPSEPKGPKEVKCLLLNIEASARWLRLTMQSDTSYRTPRVLLHEFEISPLYLEMNDTGTSKVVRRLQVDSVTGRIRVGREWADFLAQ